MAKKKKKKKKKCVTQFSVVSCKLVFCSSFDCGENSKKMSEVKFFLWLISPEKKKKKIYKFDAIYHILNLHKVKIKYFLFEIIAYVHLIYFSLDQ